MLSVASPPLPIPRQATPRDHSRPTYGGHTGAVAAALGWPLLPWQQYVADVAGELDEHGQFVYPTVVVTVPRQSGKTTLDLADSMRNCYQGPGRFAWYTAQSGQHASEKWRQMINDQFLQSPLRDTGKPGFSNGKEALRLYNGSTFRPHPPTIDSLHGKQSDKNTVDEAWHFPAAQGAALLQAITPTTTTRRKTTGQRPQLWIFSTEGTAESDWFNEMLDKIRAGGRPDVAFFDWGISPELAFPDMDDPAEVAEFLDAVYAAHPAAGHLFEREDLDGWLRDLDSISEFARAYGNRRTGATERVIPAADWNNAQTVVKIPEDSPLCFGASVAMDATDATITVTGRTSSGEKITEVIEHRPGTAWVIPRLKELCDLHGAPAVIDRGGPSADLYDQAVRADLPLVDLNLMQLSAACQAVFTGIMPRREDGTKAPPVWLHRPHRALNDAAELAAKRSVQDGAWVWGRRASVGSISALEAATLSTWGIDHLPEKVGLQLF